MKKQKRLQVDALKSQSVNSQVLSFTAQHYFFVQIYLEFGR